jgi:hypothetical protein
MRESGRALRDKSELERKAHTELSSYFNSYHEKFLFKATANLN